MNFLKDWFLLWCLWCSDFMNITACFQVVTLVDSEESSKVVKMLNYFLLSFDYCTMTALKFSL